MTTQGQPKFISRQVDQARYFYLNLEPDPAEPFAVVCGGCEHCLSNYHMVRAGFQFLSLEYVLAGRGRLRLAGTEYPLGKGSVFTYGPNVPHEILSDGRDPLVKYFVDFSGPRGRALLREHHLEPGTATRVSVPRLMMDIWELLLQNATSGTGLSRAICNTLLELLILKIAENARTEDTQQSRAFSTYLACRLHIEEHFLQLNTLEDIAAGCHLDRTYLCRLFQRYDKQSPYQMLVRLKMGQAAQMLANSDMLVKQVAQQLGFADPYHFTRVFKRVYGVSPQRFILLSRRPSPQG